MESIYLTPSTSCCASRSARFVAREVEPHALAWEDAGMTPREVLRKLGTAGLLGLMYDEEHGGAGADALTNLVFAEALSQSTFGGFIITVLVHTDMASPHLHHAGSAAQKVRWMSGITAGRTITAVAITEPGAGSDVAGIRTTAARSADGSEVDPERNEALHHQRRPCRPVLRRRQDRTGRHAMSIFAVEKGTSGFSVGRSLDKTGWLSSDTAELVFADCRIPAANLLGEENRGFQAVMKNFQTERIALAAMAVGHCMQALQATLAHVRERSAFGAPLFDKQVVRQRLAMLDAKVRAARSYLYHCAWRVTQGHDVVQDVSMLKALTGELVNEVVQACQQFHGGMGYMRGTVIERLWRDARILAIGGGATEVMLDEAAKRY
jgi:acyl-CoA dehydrogenase